MASSQTRLAGFVVVFCSGKASGGYAFFVMSRKLLEATRRACGPLCRRCESFCMPGRAASVAGRFLLPMALCGCAFFAF
jgi:hypothetical protein